MAIESTTLHLTMHILYRVICVSSQTATIVHMNKLSYLIFTDFYSTIKQTIVSPSLHAVYKSKNDNTAAECIYNH